MDLLKEMGGAYILYFEVNESIFIERPREANISGPLAYVGSALGKAGFQRVVRHLAFNESKNITWHIDQILRKTKPRCVYLMPSSEKIECKLSETFSSKFSIPVKHFGSSDCKCDSHLFSVNMFHLEMMLTEANIPFIKFCVKERNGAHDK